MKHSKWVKIISLFLSLLFIIEILPMTVWAKDYDDAKMRQEFFDSTLSNYLKDFVDTKDAVKIIESDKGEQNVLTLENTDGSRTAYSFSEPISFIDKDGKTQYKDTNIVSVSDKELIEKGYTYQNGTNDYKIYLSEKVSEGILIRGTNKFDIKVKPVTKNSSKGKLETVKDDDNFEFEAVSCKDAFDKYTTLRYYPQLNGYKDEIEISKYNGKTSYSYILETDGAVAAINSYGDIEIIDPETKEIVDTFLAPFAYDSSGGVDPTSVHFTNCTFELKELDKSKYEITVNIPKEYLTAKTTKYPVIVDPTTSNIYMTYDTAVYSGKPTMTSGSNITANCGKSGSGYGYGRALFYFVLPSGISSFAYIASAKLYLRETTGYTTNMYLRPNLVTSTWNESISWNTKPSATQSFSYTGASGVSMDRKNINGASTDVSGSRLWFALNLTHAARAWKTTTSNLGVMLISEYESSSSGTYWRAFATKNHTTSAYKPYAVINYTNDTTAPTISSVSGNPTAYTKNNVTLTVSASDNLYGVRYYSFDNGSTWQTGNSKTFSSNQTVNIKVKDYAGNVSATKSVVINKIDKTAPSIIVSKYPFAETYGTVTAFYTITDNASLKSYTLTGNGTTSGNLSGTSYYFEKTYYGNTNVSLVVTDTAGNSSTETFTISNIINGVSDITEPEAPGAYIQNDKVYLFSRSYNFTEGTDAPEHLEYKIGSNGTWKEYSEPLDIVNTSDVTVYARVYDEADNYSTTTSIVKPAMSFAFKTSFEDIILGSSLLPISFTRTYSSDKGWHFPWETTLETIASGYKFTDFYGEENYYILDKEGKYKDSDGLEIKAENGTVLCSSYAYVLEYGSDTKCYFDSSKNLVAVDDGKSSAKYAFTQSSVTITDKAGDNAVVTLSNGKPTQIVYTKQGTSKTVSYTWSGNNLTSFTDAKGYTHQYSYTNGLLSSFDSQNIEYTSGRPARISKPDGSFVVFTYNDTHASKDSSLPTNIGAVTVKDSKGVTNKYYYSDGIDINGLIGNYSDNAVYNPSSISNSLGTNTIDSSVLYEVAVATNDEETEPENGNEGEEQNSGSSDNQEEENTLYIQNADLSYTFFKYDDNSNVIETLLVPRGSLTVTADTTYENAEAVATQKTVYSYTNNGQISTYAICSRIYNWREIYSEEYYYDSYGNVTRQITSNTTYEKRPGTEIYDGTTVSNITEYTYDCWNQCTGIVYNKDSQNEITVSTSYDALGKQTSITSGNETVSYTYNSLGDILTATNSDGTTTYTYQNGLVVSRVNPDNTTASYVYDSYGNLTNHSYNGYSFTYNTLGSILTANSGSQNLATYTYSQDTKQNVLTASYGNGQTLSYSYNSDNELQGVNYGGSTKYGYTYTKNSNDEITATTVVDEVSNLISVIEDNKTTVKASDNSIKYIVEQKSKEESNDDFTGTQITIGSTVFKTETAGNSDNFVKNDTDLFTKTNEKNSSGNIIRTQTGNAITTSYGYRGDGKISGVNNTMGNLGLEYSYSYNGNDGVATETLIRHDRGSLGETLDSALVTNYTYDSKGQLIATENNDTKWTYTYDQRGNILTAKEYEISETNGVRTYTLKPNGQKNYTYDSTWGDKLVSVGGQSISYDSVGNPTSYRGNSLTWSMGRELASFGGVSYTYNDNGIRTSKTSNGVTTEYFLDGADIIRQSGGTTTLDFFYDGSGNLTGFEYQGNIYYYVKNLQNDIVAITDVNGNVLAEYTYSPFGEVLSVTDSNTTVGNLNPFRYRSYYFDTDTGLYYLQSRYYDPEIGRFLNSDDVNYIGATASELSYNPFAYCENDPVNGVDPLGNFWINKWLTAGLGALSLICRILGIGKDIRDIHKLTKNRLATLLYTAIPYAASRVSAYVITCLIKVAIITSIASTLFSFVSACLTGGVSFTVKKVINFILSGILPSICMSVLMLYNAIIKKKGSYITVSWKGVGYRV